LLLLGTAKSVKKASFMVLSSKTMSGLFLWIVQFLLWTCHSKAYSLSSLTWIVAHIYNMSLVIPLTVHIWWPTLHRQCWLLECDEYNQRELVHVMNWLCVERFLNSLSIFCRYHQWCSGPCKI